MKIIGIFLFFSDLNLLISKDLSRIGDFHESSALLQVPDLPYEYVEHISYFVEEDGSYSQEINNIITYVKDNLEKGFYVVVELDQYFVNPVLNGHRALRHLVYGYNDIKKQFYCRGFVDKKFSSYKMDYHDFAMAYEYSKIVNVKAPVFLELYKPKAAYSEIEKEKTIEEGLYRYFKGKNTYAVLQDEEKNVRWQNCEEYVGHIASERFIWLLELVIAGKAELCYQCVHAFYENKLMLFERGIYSFGKKGYELIEKVVYYANLARYHYIKYEITRNKVEIMSCYKLCQKCIEVEKAYFQLHFE